MNRAPPSRLLVSRDLLRRLKEQVHHHVDHHPNSNVAALVREADALLDAEPKHIRVGDDDAFVLSEALALGSVRDNGDLRLIATQPDGTEVPLQLPNKWLHGEMGVAAFIRANCTKEN